MRDPDLSDVAHAWKNPDSIYDAEYIEEFGHDHGTLRSWIVNGPFHTMWSWWVVFVVHLRDIPGAPSVNKQYPEAEYEFNIVSLNAGGSSTILPFIDIDAVERSKENTLPFLMPPDVTFQFHGVTDEQAATICDAAVNLIVQGQSPDSDFRNWWKENLALTVSHFILGVHE